MTTERVGHGDATDPAVEADHVLLDILGGAGRTPGDTDGELTRRLASWRREVHADSNRLLVDTDTALLVIAAGGRRPWWRHLTRSLGELYSREDAR